MNRTYEESESSRWRWKYGLHLCWRQKSICSDPHRRLLAGKCKSLHYFLFSLQRGLLYDDYASDLEIDSRYLISGWSIERIYEKTQSLSYFLYDLSTFFTRRLKINVGFKIGAAVIVLIDLNWSNYKEQSSNFIVQYQIKTFVKDVIT